MIVVIGPTASGKSALAMALAQRADGQILSIDSMQVYRGMDIGTAKPAPAERAAVAHHLIDVVDPNQTFTVARYVQMADEVIAEAGRNNVPLVAAGGTPMYAMALFRGLFEGPPADELLRERLRAMGNADLYARLKQVDPAAAERIHENDTRRLVRALEVHELTGRPISSFQTEWDSASFRHPATWIGLAWDRDALNRRINARVKAMMAAGWVEETRELLKRYGEFSATAAEATGYQQLASYLAGESSLEDALEEIKIATRQLARRQMKWFKRFAQVKWIEGDRPLEEQVRQASEYWRP